MESGLGHLTLGPDNPLCSQAATSIATPSGSRAQIGIRTRRSVRGDSWQRAGKLDTQQDTVRRVEEYWEEDSASLRGTIADLETKNEKLSTMLQNFKNAQKDCEEAVQDPKESQFRIYHQQMWQLEQDKMKLESAANFFELDASQSRSLQVEHIDESMEQIQSELESILRSCDISSLQLSTAVEHGSDLETLLISCLDIGETPDLLNLRLKECISQFEVPVIVRALVLTALNDWVFKTSFPPFKSEGATSLYLKSIQEIALEHRKSNKFCNWYSPKLTNSGDWAWLRNFETAAYSRFLERSEFKEGLLPMRSTSLARRLSAATASFIVQVPWEVGLAEFPRGIDSVFETLHARFKEVFSASLNFKAATAATDNRYEFIVMSPHALGTEMSREPPPRSTSILHEATQMRGGSRSWVHASLRVYMAGPADWLNPRSNAIIQTDNFVPGLSEKHKCIYSKDIAVERSDIRLDGSGFSIHSPVSNSNRLQRDPIVQASETWPSMAHPGPRMRGSVNNELGGGNSRSTQHVSSQSADDPPDHRMSTSSWAKEISSFESPRDRDEGSLSDLTSVEEQYDVDFTMKKAGRETTRNKGKIFGQVASTSHLKTSPHVCLACGTPLSNLDCLRRHEKKGTIHENQIWLPSADKNSRFMPPM
jgi:hypothetical protein